MIFYAQRSKPRRLPWGIAHHHEWHTVSPFLRPIDPKLPRPGGYTRLASQTLNPKQVEIAHDLSPSARTICYQRERNSRLPPRAPRSLRPRSQSPHEIRASAASFRSILVHTSEMSHRHPSKFRHFPLTITPYIQSRSSADCASGSSLPLKSSCKPDLARITSTSRG